MMKTLILWLVTIGTLCGQDIVGTWQGSVTLANGDVARMVMKVDRDNGGLFATLYPNIDGAPRPVPATAVALQGSALSITFVPGRMGYEGKLDGNAVTGTLTQGPGQLTLNMVRATAATAWTIPPPPPPAGGMAADARLTFDVATVKPAPPDAQNSPFRVSGGRIEILNRPLTELIKEAFAVHASQIVGASGWMVSERWDVVGTPAAPGRPSQEQMHKIQQNFLAERFGLKFHMEERELPVYVISMGRTGQHKLRASGRNDDLPGGDFRGPGSFLGRNTSMTTLAELLQLVVLDRPVLDKTGIAGRFDFSLDWRPDEFQYGGRGATLPGTGDRPDLFTAFQEQLGLKLEAAKAPATVFVIDNVHRPSEN